MLDREINGAHLSWASAEETVDKVSGDQDVSGQAAGGSQASWRLASLWPDCQAGSGRGWHRLPTAPISGGVEITAGRGHYLQFYSETIFLMLFPSSSYLQLNYVQSTRNTLLQRSTNYYYDKARTISLLYFLITLLNMIIIPFMWILYLL